jgi:hypothetical protein
MSVASQEPALHGHGGAEPCGNGGMIDLDLPLNTFRHDNEFNLERNGIVSQFCRSEPFINRCFAIGIQRDSGVHHVSKHRNPSERISRNEIRPGKGVSAARGSNKSAALYFLI